MVQPSITFASLVWWPGCQTASAKKRLSSMQRLVWLGIMGAMCTTIHKGNTLVSILIPGDFESYSACQNNLPIGTTVPKDIEQHFHPPFCRTFGLHRNGIASGLAKEGTVH